MADWNSIKEKIKKASAAPGIYIFRARRKPLYVGKAGNLKNRLKSYLGEGFKNERLQKNADDLEIIPLRSEIEALLREAALIKKLKPPYNVLWRDDANYFYAAFTREKFPKIFITHQKGLKIRNSKLEISTIGPFTDGKALRLTLKLLRRSFPYCTCRTPHLYACLNSQIGNCYSFCCNKNSSSSHQSGINWWEDKPTKEQIKIYRKNINVIKKFLLGNPSKDFSKNLDEKEKAALEKVLAHREYLDNFDLEKSIPQENPREIECYDISHLAGRETIGAMTHWLFDGENMITQKNLWRKFLIRTAKPGDDPAAIYETLSRRLNHPEWKFPDLIIIDGGISQFHAAEKAFLKSKNYKLKTMKIISFAKPNEMVYPPTNVGGRVYGLAEKPKPLAGCPQELQKIIPRAIQETHNFAVRSHRHRRRKEFLESFR